MKLGRHYLLGLLVVLFLVLPLNNASRISPFIKTSNTPIATAAPVLRNLPSCTPSLKNVADTEMPDRIVHILETSLFDSVLPIMTVIISIGALCWWIPCAKANTENLLQICSLQQVLL